MAKNIPEPTTNVKIEPQTSSAGVLVLQWLTYAFWGWLIIALIWLMSVVLVNAILHESVSEVVPYAIAATVVLLPLAFVTDLFYRKYEPLRKAGAATVIMVIHAVIFALLGIGALITSVFTGLNALINDTPNSDSTTVVVLVALFATVLYGAAFLRTLNPFKKTIGSRIYAFAMLGAAVLLLIIAVVGPVVTTLASRGDRQLEQAVVNVNRAVQDYVSENNELPKDLNAVTLDEDSDMAVVRENKIEYRPEGAAPTTSENEFNTQKRFRYQLCVTYTHEGKNNRSSYYRDRSSNNRYTSYPMTTSHDAGRTCYKLQTY